MLVFSAIELYILCEASIREHAAPGALVAAAVIVSRGLASYAKMSLFVHLQALPDSLNATLHGGTAMQAGAFFGSLVAFVLVECTDVFVSPP